MVDLPLDGPSIFVIYGQAMVKQRDALKLPVIKTVAWPVAFRVTMHDTEELLRILREQHLHYSLIVEKQWPCGATMRTNVFHTTACARTCPCPVHGTKSPDLGVFLSSMLDRRYRYGIGHVTYQWWQVPEDPSQTAFEEYIEGERVSGIAREIPNGQP